MVFKLAEAAEKGWRRLDGHNQLPMVMHGVKFTDGRPNLRRARHRALRKRLSPLGGRPARPPLGRCLPLGDAINVHLEGTTKKLNIRRMGENSLQSVQNNPREDMLTTHPCKTAPVSNES
jgi:hypothetical protein